MVRTAIRACQGEKPPSRLRNRARARQSVLDAWPGSTADKSICRRRTTQPCHGTAHLSSTHDADIEKLDTNNTIGRFDAARYSDVERWRGRSSSRLRSPTPGEVPAPEMTGRSHSGHER
jgi:hypothetical protein